MSAIIHGCSKNSKDIILDYSYSVNPMGMPPGVTGVIEAAARGLGRYPDRTQEELKAAAGAFYNVAKEYIYAMNGASEAIYMLMRAMNQSKKILLAEPMFTEYAAAAKAAGLETEIYYAEKEKGFVIDSDILDRINADTGAVVLCNPGNPTGVLTSVHFLEQILYRCVHYGAYLVLDECFLDLYDGGECASMLSYIKEYSNLVVLRAVTKSFAMPGIRLGFVMTSDREMLAKIDRNTPPWNVSALAQAAGIYVMSASGDYLPQKYLEDSRQKIITERENLMALVSKSYKVYDSSVNYFFFKGDKELGSRLLERGVIIRCCEDFEGLCSGYYRIAVKSREENERFIGIWQTL